MAKAKKNTIKDVNRVPIVSILGHVDHGKTTILDYIRDTHVQSGEAGGITQKISVFTISLNKDEKKRITFVDTPGHEAFDLMRSRGGSIADIVLLIVAGNDGVKPQTVESIDIIKKSTAKPIVVINKCDLPEVNIEKIKRDIVNQGLLVEGLGGEIPVVQVSGKTGKGIPELLDMITLVGEVEGLQDRGELPAHVGGKAYVLESVKEEFRGNVSTLVLVNGNFCKGDWFGFKNDSGIHIEKVKGIVSEEGENICDLSSGCGGKIIGVSELLPLGMEVFILQKNDPKIIEGLYKKEQKEEVKEEEGEQEALAEDEIFGAIFEEEKKDGDMFLNVVIKASSQGALEALRSSLEKLNIEGYMVKVVLDGVGNIGIKDIDMAKVSKSIVLGFEVGTEKGVEDIARKEGVLVRTYSIIYKLIEEVEAALDMLAAPQTEEEEIGSAVVKLLFTLTDGSLVIGSRVKSGVLKRDCKVYVVRNDEILGEGKIVSLRKSKSIVTEVKQGEDCGAQINIDVDVEPGDELYCYKVVR
jgi:translation initiation factor IF-2